MGKGGHGFWEHLPQSWLTVINHKFNWLSDILMLKQYAGSDDHQSLAGISALFLVLNPYLMSWLCTVILVPDDGSTSSDIIFKCTAPIGLFHVIAWIAIFIAFALADYDPPADDDDCLFGWQNSMVIYSEADWQEGDTQYWPKWTCPMFVLVVLSPGWIVLWYRMMCAFYTGPQCTKGSDRCVDCGPKDDDLMAWLLTSLCISIPVTFVSTIFAMLSPSYMQKLCGANPERHVDQMEMVDADDALGKAKCAWHCFNSWFVPNITNKSVANNQLGSKYVGKLGVGAALRCFVALSVIHNIPQFVINVYYTSQSDEDMTLLSKLSMLTSFLSFAITACINMIKSNDQDDAAGAQKYNTACESGSIQLVLPRCC
jgi:hypothetical protein